MKHILYLVLFITTLIGCKKNNENSSNSSSYYFNCEVDGKKINLTYVPTNNGTASNGVYFAAYAMNVIHIDAKSSQCSTNGSYCITQAMDIYGQKTGDYKISSPHTFLLYTTEGSDLYAYTSNSGVLNVTISKIEHNGHLEGTFSGTVSKQKFNNSPTASYPIVNISGSLYTVIWGGFILIAISYYSK